MTDQEFQAYSLYMGKCSAEPRLIIVCRLPGSVKTTLAKDLELKLGGVRFSADERMSTLSIDLYDEGKAI